MPRWGMRRIQAKVTLRHFEAAGTGRRTANWYRSSTDANAANAPSLAKLREISRDLRRNNGWAKRAIQTITNNVVGRGIVAKPVADDARVLELARSLWRRWAMSTGCDYDGRLNFAGLQRLAMESVIESGEVLIVRQRASAVDGLPVPLRLRVLEPDYIDTSRTSYEGRIVQQGIELDGEGRRVAYWLYPTHPGARHVGSYASYPSAGVRVPASDVIHVYHVDRPGQLRGVPWLAAAIAKLHDFDDLDDARLMQQKIAACFSAFVVDLDGSATNIGEPDDDDDKFETFEPGQIGYLRAGQDIKSFTPPTASDHGAFGETQLRRIAVSLGITYEDLTGDYSKVNFSSARMARLAHWANVHEWRATMLEPQMLTGVWEWFVELAAGLYRWRERPAAEWSAPPMPMLSPDKEGLSYTRLIRSGVMTPSEAIRERGGDPAQHLAEYAEDLAALDELGIVLDSDARKVSGSGGAQPPALSGLTQEPTQDADP